MKLKNSDYERGYTDGYADGISDSPEEQPVLLEAMKAVVEDLENAGEILLTDEARIQVLQVAIAQVEGKES